MQPTSDRHPQARSSEPADASKVVDAFLQALIELEDSRDVAPLAELYAEDAAVGNVQVGEKYHGQAGAREFWTMYRGTFEEIRSTFHNRIVAENAAALEWTSVGTLTGGEPFHYDGVTVLQIERGQLSGSRAYFNARELGRPMVSRTQEAARGATS